VRLLGRELRLTIDGDRAVGQPFALPNDTGEGGIGVGVSRERRSSPRPRFTSLSVARHAWQSSGRVAVEGER
jgi:hypothetical protein